MLTALAVHLRALEADVGPGEIQDRIAEMRRSLAEASVGLRELTTRLRPTAIDEHGLADAIEEQAARLRRTGLGGRRGAPRPRRLPSPRRCRP